MDKLTDIGLDDRVTIIVVHDPVIMSYFLCRDSWTQRQNHEWCIKTNIKLYI